MTQPDNPLYEPIPDEFCTDCNGFHPPHDKALAQALRQTADAMFDILEEVEKKNWGRAMAMGMIMSEKMADWASIVGLNAMRERSWGEPLDSRFGDNLPPFPPFPPMG